jgi:hypothetical protein
MDLLPEQFRPRDHSKALKDYATVLGIPVERLYSFIWNSAYYPLFEPVLEREGLYHSPEMTARASA